MSNLNIQGSDSNIKDRIIDVLNSLVSSISYFDDLFSLDAGKLKLLWKNFFILNKFNFLLLDKNIESYDSLISDTTFTIEALKDDGFVLSKIPTYLKSKISFILLFFKYKKKRFLTFFKLRRSIQRS